MSVTGSSWWKFMAVTVETVPSVGLWNLKKIWFLTELLRPKLVKVMEFQLSYFKSWKMMLWKCWTQYASKFGKLSSGYRTGKCQFSFQSQRRAMPRKVQTTILLLISYVSQVMLKTLQAMLQQYVTWELPKYKLDLEKTEEPEIKLSTFIGS